MSRVFVVAIVALVVVTAAGAAGPKNGLVTFVRCCAPAGILVIGPEGRGERMIYRAAFDDAPLTPAWSPSGREIAFVPGAPRRGVWIMRGDGSRKHRLTAGKGDPLSPSWSPDGRRVVFADRPGDLYVVRVNGAGLEAAEPSDRPGDASGLGAEGRLDRLRARSRPLADAS